MTFENELKVICSKCGQALDATQSEAGIQVDPCPYCLDVAFEFGKTIRAASQTYEIQ